MRLEDGDHPAFAWHGGTCGGERCGELCRVVGIVVDYAYLSALSFELEAAAYATEILEGPRRLAGIVAEPAGYRDRRQGVEYVVAPAYSEFDHAASPALLKQHVAARSQDIGPQVS